MNTNQQKRRNRIRGEISDEKASKQNMKVNLLERDAVVWKVTTLFGLEEEMCNITILTYESPKEVLKIPSKYIDFISEKLNTLVAGNETKEIDVTELDISMETIEQAISFYHPKNSIQLDGKGYFSVFDSNSILLSNFNSISLPVAVNYQ